MRRIKFITALGLILITAGGCATSFAGDFCQIYAPVYNTHLLPEPQRTEVEMNNAVYMEKCL